MENDALLGALMGTFINPMKCLFARRLKLQILVRGDPTNPAIHLQLGCWFERAREKLYL